MNSIQALAAGIRGAENGHANILKRGTSSHATLYEDFEGKTPYTPSEAVDLDANGSLVVYVSEVVDVVVYDSNWSVVREFTEGVSAGSIEVISQSFTGTDYETQQSSTALPTTLQAVLDAWLTSSGAKDWNVALGPAKTASVKTSVLTLGNALYNVKAFGAVGDGATNDQPAIQAAIQSANIAGGGIVFFPPGSYRITDYLTIPATVSLWGSGPNASTILVDTAATNCLYYPSATLYWSQEVRDLRIVPAQVNTGNLVSLASAAYIAFHNCHIGVATLSKSTLVSASSGNLSFDACYFTVGSIGGVSSKAIACANLSLNKCYFYVPSAAYSESLVSVTGPASINVTGCTFDASSVTSGTCNYITRAAGALSGNITGNYFMGLNAIGATLTAMNLGALGSAVGNFYESANAFGSNIARYSYSGPSSVTKLVLGSRALGCQELEWNGAGGAYTLQSDQYQHINIKYTDASARTINANAAPYGSRLTLTFDVTGGNTVTFGAAFKTSVATFTPGGGKVRCLEFIYAYDNAAAQGYWYQTAALGGDM